MTKVQDLETLDRCLAAGRCVQIRIPFDDGLPDQFVRIRRWDGNAYHLIEWSRGPAEWCDQSVTAPPGDVAVWMERGSARLVPRDPELEAERIEDEAREALELAAWLAALDNTPEGE
jgi:hypothetical protein